METESLLIKFLIMQLRMKNLLEKLQKYRSKYDFGQTFFVRDEIICVWTNLTPNIFSGNLLIHNLNLEKYKILL